MMYWHRRPVIDEEGFQLVTHCRNRRTQHKTNKRISKSKQRPSSLGSVQWMWVPSLKNAFMSNFEAFLLPLEVDPWCTFFFLFFLFFLFLLWVFFYIYKRRRNNWKGSQSDSHHFHPSNSIQVVKAWSKPLSRKVSQNHHGRREWVQKTGS